MLDLSLGKLHLKEGRKTKENQGTEETEEQFGMEICIIERQVYAPAVLWCCPSAGTTNRSHEHTREGGERFVLYCKRRDGTRGSTAGTLQEWK